MQLQTEQMEEKPITCKQSPQAIPLFFFIMKRQLCCSGWLLPNTHCCISQIKTSNHFSFPENQPTLDYSSVASSRRRSVSQHAHVLHTMVPEHGALRQHTNSTEQSQQTKVVKITLACSQTSTCLPTNRNVSTLGGEKRR